MAVADDRPVSARKAELEEMSHMPKVAVLLWALLATTILFAEAPASSEASRPNTVLIMAHDLGFSDIGSHDEQGILLEDDQ